jgi:hypothetical protein
VDPDQGCSRFPEAADPGDGSIKLRHGKTPFMQVSDYNYYITKYKKSKYTADVVLHIYIQCICCLPPRIKSNVPTALWCYEI